MARDDIATVESDTNYEIADRPGCDLAAIPAFVGEGWFRAKKNVPDAEYVEYVVEDEDRGLKFSFIEGWESDFALKELAEHNHQHVQQRGEEGNSGHGQTRLAGDFYIDFRKDNRQWTGRNWEGGDVEVRVRRRPDTPEQTTVVADATDIIERSTDGKGRVTLGADYADKDVKVAILSDE